MYNVNGWQAVNGPAWAGYLPTGLSPASDTITPLTMVNTFDTDLAWSGSAFNPKVPGYYFVTLQVAVTGTSGGYQAFFPIIYKNGATLVSYLSAPVATTYYGGSISFTTAMNGTTDTISFGFLMNFTGSWTISSTNTCATIFMVHGA
jgi:hypothetical protein